MEVIDWLLLVSWVLTNAFLFSLGAAVGAIIATKKITASIENVMRQIRGAVNAIKSD